MRAFNEEFYPVSMAVANPVKKNGNSGNNLKFVTSQPVHSSVVTISKMENNRKDILAWQPKKRNTILAVFIATIGAFSLGTTLTYSAPVLVDPEFKERFPDIGNGSWVASIALLGALLSAPISGILIAKLGRKGTMLWIALPFAAGWGMIAFAPTLTVLYCGRFVTGFCGGTFTVIIPAYVSEVAEDSYRGMLAVTLFFMVNLGTLFLFILAAYQNWFVLSVASGCIPIIHFFSMGLIPESPRYLVEKDNIDGARDALKWLRSAPDESHIDPEVTKIVENVDASKEKRKQAKIRHLFDLRVLKPIGICVALLFFSRFSGMNGISLYTVEIFEEAGTGMNASLVSIVIVATQIATMLVVPFMLVDKMGRRSLLIISLAVMMLSLVALGYFFYLKDKNGGEVIDALKWLPLASFVIITIGVNLGLGSIPWVITSEILPDDVKELASSFISICYWLLTFVSGKTFQDLIDLLGYMGVYWLSAGICLAGALFVFFIVPETKGKSFEEIQALFATKNVNDGKPKRKVTSMDNPAYIE